MLLNEYVESLQVVIQRLDDFGLAESIEFKEENKLYFSAKVVLIDRSELYLREYVNGNYGIERVDYSYQYQSGDKTLIFRYDNSKHKPPLGFDDHKHQRDGSIIPWQIPSIDEVVDEVIASLG